MSRAARRRRGAATACAMLVAAALTPATATAATPLIAGLAGTGGVGAPTAGSATSSRLNAPGGVAVDSSGNVYIADTGNNVVEKVTPAGVLSIVAGTGTAGAPTAGSATSSRLNAPGGVAVDSSGNVYIADTSNNVVDRVTSGGVLSVFAGTGTAGLETPGPAAASKLNAPGGVAVDSSGNVYIADTNNNAVEKVTPAGVLAIAAGGGLLGTGLLANLKAPQGVGVDTAGDLFIADTGDNQVDEVIGTSATVIAGTGTSGAPSYGTAATSSRLRSPQDVAVDAAGDVDIADTLNQTIDQVNVPGTLSLATSAAPSFSDNLDSGDATPTYTVPLTVQNTGAGAEAGWDLTITSTQFTTSGATPSTLPVGASSATAVAAACATGSCVTPANSVASPLAVPAGTTAPTAVKLYQAQTGSGIGSFTVTPTIAVSVPQNSMVGSYTSTVTVSLVSGP